MIDWHAVGSHLASLVPGLDRACADLEHRAERVVLRNRSFPLSPLPVLVDAGAAAAHAPVAQAWVRLLDKVVRCYLEHPDLRRWFGLDAMADEFVRADLRLGGRVVVCRLDGYLDQATQRLKVLENNADAPAGTVFTARVNHAVLGCVRRFSPHAPEPDPLTYLDEDLLHTTLIDCAKQAGAARPEHVAVIQPGGEATPESGELVDALTRRGLHAYVADPRELRVVGGRARFGARPVDVCWNKVNTGTWHAIMSSDGEAGTTWLRALRESSLINVNPFGARYVAEDKSSLALPFDPEFAALFDADERELAARLVPPTRRLTEDAPATDGAGTLVDEVLLRQHEFVLKARYGIRGDGVVVGRSVDRATWEAAVAAGLRGRHVVQQAVEPTRYPVLGAQPPGVVPMPISLDSYVLDGRFAGFGSKGSPGARVNVAQGGRKLAVHVVPRGW